jgi:hypothetical protein
MGGSGRLTSLAVVRSELDRRHHRYPNSHSCRVHDWDHLLYLAVSESMAFSGYTTEKKRNGDQTRNRRSKGTEEP